MDKQELRERIWALLEERGVARFPRPLRDRIPNFHGAELAAARAAELPEWKAAKRVKCNPDSPQRPLRLRALQAGKLVFMAVPRLKSERCFLRLDPRKLRGKLSQAATIRGASALGESVAPEELGRIDLVVVGSVAVNRWGARVGKGGGYSDLEFAIARQFSCVDEEVPVLTTVHELQVLAEEIPMTGHDVPLDIIVTPEGVFTAEHSFEKPKGLLWNELSEEQIEAMPVLQSLRKRKA